MNTVSITTKSRDIVRHKHLRVSTLLAIKFGIVIIVIIAVFVIGFVLLVD